MDFFFLVDNIEFWIVVEGDILVLFINVVEFELFRSFGVLIKDVEDFCLVGKVDGIMDVVKCFELFEWVEFILYYKREVSVLVFNV